MVMTCLRIGLIWLICLLPSDNRPSAEGPEEPRQQVEGIKGDFNKQKRDLPKRMQKIADPAERTTAPSPI
jgi:hypothetical protein